MEHEPLKWQHSTVKFMDSKNYTENFYPASFEKVTNLKLIDCKLSREYTPAYMADKFTLRVRFRYNGIMQVIASNYFVSHEVVYSNFSEEIAEQVVTQLAEATVSSIQSQFEIKNTDPSFNDFVTRLSTELKVYIDAGSKKLEDKVAFAAGGFVKTNDISVVSQKLPAMDTHVACPECKSIFGLWSQVQHLNDTHKWSREKIADWIDELHESGVINAEFEPWNEDGEENSEDALDGWKPVGYTIDEGVEFNDNQD